MNIIDPNDPAYTRVYQKLKQRLEVGELEQARLISSVAALVIRDKLVAPANMFFSPLAEGNSKIGISYLGSTDERVYSIHRHALGQIAAKVGFPVVYVNMLQQASKENWKSELLAYNLNMLYHNEEFKDRAGFPRFLHRIVGEELRGFLSRRFNRHIASAPLLRSFLEACQAAGAFPVEATTSPVKLALKCTIPHIFEPVPGQFLCVGVEWANSDFGAGRMQVALSLWMPHGDKFTVLDQVLSRVHIGSVIEDSDIELSEETAQKESEAQASAIRDAVSKQLEPESIDRLLEAVRTAHEEDIPWDKLRPQLARYLGKSDVESLQQMLNEGSVDLPPVKNIGGEPVPTKWWASNALAFLANRTEDPEKKLDLQHAAGAFLEVK